MLLNLTECSPEPLRSQTTRQVRGKILRGDLKDGAVLPRRPASEEAGT